MQTIYSHSVGGGGVMQNPGVKECPSVITSAYQECYLLFVFSHKHSKQ